MSHPLLNVWSRVIFVCALLSSAACRDDAEPLGPRVDVPEPNCLQANAAFVREATLALLGRRSHSEAETQALAQFISQVDETQEVKRPSRGRRALVRALMETPEFVDRWQEILLDALQVPRTDVQALPECYGTRVDTKDDAELARYVREHDARKMRKAPFTFLDLVRSSLALDDLSPVYRAHLFAMLTKPNACGNVDPVKQELLTRQEVGHVFDAAYTNRDQVCLACHNSETSVTYDPVYADNRHFAIPANLEKAVFGASNGVPEAVAHAVFRTDGFLTVSEGELAFCADQNPAYCGDRGTPVCDDMSMPTCPSGKPPRCTEDLTIECPGEPPGSSAQMLSPWGADPGCGLFNRKVEDDPAKVAARLASVSGLRATVFDLEQALARGVEALAKEGLVVDERRDVKDPDAALAYLLALNIVDIVWREVVGSSLTISTRFPRTFAARDLLSRLTAHFVAERFSLKTLLLDILETRYFNELGPEAGCGEPYSLPPVWNPWVRDEPDPAMRANSSADGVHALSARTLLFATYAALDWPVPSTSRFPGIPPATEDGGMLPETDEVCFAVETCDEIEAMCEEQSKCCSYVSQVCDVDLNGEDPELAFQRSVGVFLSISQKGFRGLDLSARLAWEERFGACAKPTGVKRDAVDAIMSAAVDSDAPLSDVALALKDRIVGEPRFDTGESALVEALVGAKLETRATLAHEPGIRRLCGALLSSPEHLLSGLPTRGGDPSSLGPSRARACERIMALPFEDHRVRCDGARMHVSPRKASERTAVR